MARYSGRQSSASVNNAPVKSRTSIGQPGSTTSLAMGRDFEEFASLQLDKPSEGELKTNEEMKRHLYDDHFEGRPIERAMHLLNNGEEVQRLSVIRQLLQLIQADEQGCMQRVFPKIQQALNTASTEFHIETARAFVTILEKKAIHHHAFSQTFLPSILYHIDNRDPVVSNAWLETLLEVSELLPTDIVKHEVLHVAINKGQISQSVWHRVAACKLLGKMCARFDQHTVKKDILPVVHSLCQDVNESVRACICSQLHHVAKGLPSDMVKPALIPILVELGRDETVQVRVEATETIVHMIPFLSQDVLKVTIIPLVKKICEQAVLAMDDTLVMVAKQFGSLCIGLENSLSMPEKLWMVTYYHNMSHLGIPSHGGKKDVYFTSHNMDRINARYIECRQLCAYNFPAMAKFCAPNAELLEKLFPSFCDFSTDPYYMVRKTIGAGIHEVARILGINNRVVKNQIMTLLWDSMEEVLMGVVPHLGRTIDLLISSGVLGQEQDGATLELGRGLIQCDKTIRDKTHNWRLYADFIAQLESVVKCLPSDYIYTHFVTLMFDKMHRARPLPCRLAAARTLLVFLRHNLKNNQRQEIRARIEAEFCMSSSCYKRMLFLRLCNIAREIFSRSYFKEHFFYLLLSRSEDKVANNRLLLVRQFPHLKAMIIMPTEKKYLQTLESCVRNMVASEKDKDVSAELRHSIARLDKTETLSESSSVTSAEDIEDRKKYEEEIRFANTVPRPGAGIAVSTLDSRRVVPKEVKPQQRPPNVQKMSQQMPTSSSSTASPLSPGRQERSYGAGTSSTASSRKNSPVSPDSSSLASQSSINSFTNSTNNVYTVRSSLINRDTNNDHNCTCYSFRSDYHENLNLRALIDTNIEKSKFKMLDNIKQKISSDVKYKISRSCKYNMEISWLNLETDLKNELFTLVSSSRNTHGDRNFKEKSKFLTDFRDFNDASLSKFINDDREYKETIYNVKGISNYYNRFGAGNFFEEKVNFFERKIKLEEAKSNTDFTDCSCFDLTNNRKYIEGDENKKISYFSKNFEEDFYRDAGIKANEIISRKFSGIPIYDKPQVSSPKISTSVTNKRRTWFGNENSNQNSLDLDSICKYSPRDNEKNYQRKKSETLPMRESISLEKIGIGPRSKSFILPSTLIYSDKQVTNYQSTKLIFDKQVNDILKSDGFSKNESDSTDSKNYYNNQGAIRKFRSESADATNRFGFRTKTRDQPPKVETKNENKSFTKTKIPVGRSSSSSSSPNSSRSSSPSLSVAKDKPDNDIKLQNNGTKKIPTVVSRKSLLIQSNSLKNDIKNNRRSFDSTKISLANLDKSQNHVYNRRKIDEPSGNKLKGNSHLDGSNTSGGNVEDKTDGEIVANTNSSKLPVRRTRPEK